MPVEIPASARGEAAAGRLCAWAGEVQAQTSVEMCGLDLLLCGITAVQRRHQPPS